MITKEFLNNYNDLKQKYPEPVLLFRRDDSYYAFYDDATKTADACHIAKEQEETETGKAIDCASFSFSMLDCYLPKLIRSGNKVAICDYFN